jgi:outer membrane protein TolC
VPRLVKYGLFTAPLPVAFALGFVLSRYLLDRDLRDAEAALNKSVANYDSSRQEHVARLQHNYDQIQALIDRLDGQRSIPHAKH